LLGGRTDLTAAQGVPGGTEVHALSGDGTTVVGWGSSATEGTRAFRWSGPGTYQSLGVLPGYERSSANGVSGDGSVVVGASLAGSGDIFRLAFRWTSAGGMQPLGVTPGSSISEANALSRDGQVIVGVSTSPASDVGDAFRWTASTGMQALPGLPGTL